MGSKKKNFVLTNTHLIAFLGMQTTANRTSKQEAIKRLKYLIIRVVV